MRKSEKLSLPKMLVTGSEGLLASELLPLLKDKFQLKTPAKEEMDILDKEKVAKYIDWYKPDYVLHLAAYTDVSKAEEEKELCYKVNVEGTQNLIDEIDPWMRFIYVSTDYVFDGQKGNYKETDYLNPINYYALTKTLGEFVAKQAIRYLIIRTSFKPKKWEFEKAIYDLFTSADYVDIIASEIAKAIEIYNSNFDNNILEREIIHIGTEKKSIFDLAKRRNPKVLPTWKKEIPTAKNLNDVSLNTDKWKKIKISFSGEKI